MRGGPACPTRREVEGSLKKCFKCGTVWNGYGKPRTRQICEGCGSYLHTCINCHHFARRITNSCVLPHTAFVGPRDMLNYCEEFQMVNNELQAIESRCARAKSTFENLFKR